MTWFFILKHKHKASSAQEGNELMAQSRAGLEIRPLWVLSVLNIPNKGNITLFCADDKIFLIPRKSDGTEVCLCGWQFILTGDVCKPKVKAAETIKVDCWKDTAKKQNRRENENPRASNGNYLQCQCTKAEPHQKQKSLMLTQALCKIPKSQRTAWREVSSECSFIPRYFQ